MTGWRIKWRWHLLSNKKSVRGILAISKAVVPTIVFYCVLGLVGEVFVGRLRLIHFSLWVKLWIAMIMFALISAMMFSSYDFPQWLEILLVAFPSAVQFLGLSVFQVTAVQYGTDLIQGAPSNCLSAFIYWYLCMEYLPPTVLDWVIYLLSKYALVT